MNAGLSSLLNLLLLGGVEEAQAILRATADNLPATAAQIAAVQAFDESAGGKANTDQVGRA